MSVILFNVQKPKYICDKDLQNNTQKTKDRAT